MEFRDQSSEPLSRSIQDDASELQPRRGCGGLFFCFLVLMAAAWGAGLGAFLWVLDQAETTVTQVEEFRPRVGSKIYSADGAKLGEFTEEHRQLIRLNEMPLNLQKAFVATEDDKFFEHKGVRIAAILNSFLYIAQTGHVRGGSTITQQAARNIETTRLGKEVTISRKAREAVIAFQLERKFTKDEILEMYLNQLFLGVSAWGVEAASLQYFNKSCRDLSLAESALLAGLARAPNTQEPFKNPKNALTRRGVVLGQMLENGFITQTDYDQAMAESMDDSVVTPKERAELAAQGKGQWAPNRFKAPYFVSDIRLWLLRQAGTNKEEVFGDGLEIHTTLDLRLQEAAERILLTALDEFDKKRLDELKKQKKEDEFIPVSGALVCIDNRPGYKGWVRAMVGGRDFETSKFNIVTQARRQPGSSIKPFVWAAAIENGYTPSSIILDAPFVMMDGLGRPWAPKNFSGAFEGPVSLRNALAKSVNIVSVKLVQQLGVPLVRSYYQRAGITTPIDNAVGLTLALGSPDIKIIDQCVAFSTFSNGGVHYDPIMVTEIRDRDGFTIYDHKNYIRKERAMPENVAYVVTNLLQGVATWGTGAKTARLGRPRAGKTGTTNESRNCWFCGFTPDYTCVVWFGYSDNRSLGRGRAYTGGNLACPVWTDFMIEAEKGLPIREFEVPKEGITFYNVDRETGLAGGSFREAFITGTQPPTQMPVSDLSTRIQETPDEQILEDL